MRKLFNKIIDRLKNNGDNITTDEMVEVESSQNDVGFQKPLSSIENRETDEVVTTPPLSETVEISANLSKSAQINRATEKNTHIPEKVKDIVELEEFTFTAILRSLQPFFFGNLTIASLHFHLRHNREHIESKACENLFTQEDFVEKLKVSFANKGIHYKDNLSVKITYASPQLDSYTPITTYLSVDVQMPGQSKQKLKAVVRAISGILWDNIVEIAPSAKPSYIGRCRNPKLPNGITITNKIAFIGLEEKEGSEYEINRYVSRSIALISYNEQTCEFELMRSNLMENSQHVIKIIRISQIGVEEISVNNTHIKYPLKDDDQIAFNGKVSLRINIVEDINQ